MDTFDGVGLRLLGESEDEARIGIGVYVWGEASGLDPSPENVGKQPTSSILMGVQQPSTFRWQSRLEFNCRQTSVCSRIGHSINECPQLPPRIRFSQHLRSKGFIVLGHEFRDADQDALHIGVVAIQRGSRDARCLRESRHR